MVGFAKTPVTPVSSPLRGNLICSKQLFPGWNKNTARSSNVTVDCGKWATRFSSCFLLCTRPGHGRICPGPNHTCFVITPWTPAEAPDSKVPVELLRLQHQPTRSAANEIATEAPDSKARRAPETVVNCERTHPKRQKTLEHNCRDHQNITAGQDRNTHRQPAAHQRRQKEGENDNWEIRICTHCGNVSSSATACLPHGRSHGRWDEWFGGSIVLAAQQQQQDRWLGSRCVLHASLHCELKEVA
jgi:hypothetical protein